MKQKSSHAKFSQFSEGPAYFKKESLSLGPAPEEGHLFLFLTSKDRIKQVPQKVWDALLGCTYSNGREKP